MRTFGSVAGPLRKNSRNFLDEARAFRATSGPMFSVENRFRQSQTRHAQDADENEKTAKHGGLRVASDRKARGIGGSRHELGLQRSPYFIFPCFVIWTFT
jgi:hypothetical protein